MQSIAAPISVTALNRLVREQLESAFPLLWISGEISNLAQAGSGHVYFSLKDAQAQVRCTLWRNKAALLGWRLENGQQVEVRALVGFYEARGEFQLNIESMRRSGQGDLYQRFLQLKARLEAEGLFDASGKRALPVFPRRIGIVTSPQAAALADVLTTLKRRAPHVVITLFPAPVQGEGAGQRLAAAMCAAGESDNDVLILCRGGGSLEDLWAFNDEALARAVSASPIPVVTGIGHETDFTIADFAADLRAPTPTAAAELVAPDRSLWLDRLAQLDDSLKRRLERRMNTLSQTLDLLAQRLTSPAERLAQRREHLETLAKRLELALTHRKTMANQRLQSLCERLHGARLQVRRYRQLAEPLAMRLRHAVANRLRVAASGLQAAGSALEQLDPHAVLARGYAIVRNEAGEAVRSATQLSPGDTLQLMFGRGSARATVDQIESDREGQ